MTATTVALPAHWQRWQWSAQVSAGRGIVAFSLPPTIEGNSRADFADLRVIDERGSETPFEIIMRFKRAFPVLRRYAVSQRVSQRGTQTVVTLDAGGAHVPVSSVRLTAGTDRFSRHVTLQYSGDMRIWSTAAATRFERTARSDHRELAIAEKRARYWRLLVDNENNAPLEHPRVELWGASRYVVFESRAPHRYRIIFGNRAAAKPSYDFAAAYGSRLSRPAPALAGAPQPNSAFASASVPWSESHPWVLWGALAAAIAAIGGLALRVLTFK